MLKWKMTPTDWITQDFLCDLKWRAGEGSANSAALMVYINLVVYSCPIDDPIQGLTAGESSPTYEEIQAFTGLSRALVSRGIKKLKESGLIGKRTVGTRTVYQLYKSSPNPWGRIPFKYFSKGGKLKDNIFGTISVRNKSSLHALKIYFMAIRFRSNRTNYACFSYEKITEYAGIPKFEIKDALGKLTENKLLIVDLVPALNNEYRQNVYRVSGIDPTKHLATLPEETFNEVTNKAPF